MTASVLLVAACSSGDDADNATPGTGDNAAELLGPSAPAQGEPVRIGLVTDGQSPMSDTTVEIAVGEATAEYLNEHRSGIGGRPIELLTCETQGDPAKGTDCGNQMIEENVVAVLMGNSAVSDSTWEPLHDAGVPVMIFTTSGAGALSDPDSTFVLSNASFATITLPVQLAEAEGAAKVTAIVIDVPAALDLLQNTAPPVFEEAGIDFELLTVPPGTADMTPQMQGIADDDTGLVFIIGNDAFCISAMNGLQAVGYDGKFSAISQCITDATRESVSGDLLEGTAVAATAPIGLDNPSTQLYKAVVETYGEDVDTSEAVGMSMFTTMAALQSGLEGITGDITPESIITTLKAMPEKDLPGVEGMRFRCNGNADPEFPAVCVTGGLVTTLDADGQPAAYEALGVTPIED